MVFKRRDKRSWWVSLKEAFWPKKGWGRAIQYVKHRLTRLPDAPERIARGIFAGVMVTFSPFFGLHFVLSALLSLIIRGNVVASLLATFVGNPLTFPLIITASLQTGHFVLGRPASAGHNEGMLQLMIESMSALYHNLLAPFTGATADWASLQVFYHDVFFPYMVGGVVTGAFFGLIFYFASVPLIVAYRNRRKKVLQGTWEKIKEKAAIEADDDQETD